MSNRNIVLSASLQLFNRDGVATTSTNHIAAHAGVSTGNLYYHFRDKEEILRTLFEEMRADLETLWSGLSEPEQFFRQTLDHVWKYRFFHREMYALRRIDVQLNRAWRSHITSAHNLLTAQIRSWNIVEQEAAPDLCTAILSYLSASTQIFESSLRQTRSKHIDQALSYLLRLVKSPNFA